MGSFRDSETQPKGRFRSLETKPSTGRDVVKSAGAGLASGVKAVADTVLAVTPFGAPANALNAVTGQRPGTPNALSPSNIIAPRATQAARYQPQTAPGRYAKSIAEMVPNAAAPGSTLSRVAAVVLPGVTAQGAADLADRYTDNPAIIDAARLLGGVVGGFGASARVRGPMPRNASEEQRAASILAKRGKADPAAMRGKANAMTAAGVKPTVTDVVGEPGRRIIRATGVKSEAAGQALTTRAAATTAATKPAAMVSTRRLTPDARTAKQYADETEAARDTQAQRDYGQFDAEQIEVPDAVKDMLADSSGRSIIARARTDAVENQDWGRQVELDRLLQAAEQGGVGPLPRISAGTIDRLVIAARERGAAFARRGNGNRARGAFARRQQLDTLLGDVEELKPARQAYSERSRAVEIARDDGRLDPFSTDPADYSTWLNSLPPEAQNANRIAIRQEILDTLGGQRSNTFGTLDNLATSEYARDNLRLAFGRQAADQYLSGLAARLEQTRNATFVQPNAGSRTAVLENDLGNAAKDVITTAANVKSGNVVGLLGQAADWFRSRGISDRDAQALASASTDPAKLEGVIRYLEGRYGPGAAQQYVTFARNVGLIAAATGTMAASRREADRPPS